MIRLSTVALATALVASALGHSTAAMAQARVEVGVLECRGSTTSFIVGSVTELSCVFRPVGRRAARALPAPRCGARASTSASTSRSRWRGRCLRRPADRRAAIWPATTAARRRAPRSASASAPMRWSAARATPSRLQPLSGQGQTGLSVAAGVAGLELRRRPLIALRLHSTGAAARHARRRFAIWRSMRPSTPVRTRAELAQIDHHLVGQQRRVVERHAAVDRGEASYSRRRRAP